ncbi:hypothetical protein [Streptomyces lacrimifluminis]|uniref:hypothetical protein n=1 Tax=Streptomyces lacrimifluminis TaxID=1500077 RepID=UPI001666D1BB|nr:hypothetical protein [Streptomyces lacrimifluminis]
MLVVGVSVGFPTSGKPVVSLVVLEGGRGDPVFVESCEIKTAEKEVFEQIIDLGRKFHSKLSGLKPEAVVLRIADIPTRASRAAGPRHRLMIEGALAYVCNEQKVQNVALCTGREVGIELGMSKADAQACGERLDAKHPEAASAGIVALPSES